MLRLAALLVLLALLALGVLWLLLTPDDTDSGLDLRRSSDEGAEAAGSPPIRLAGRPGAVTEPGDPPAEDEPSRGGDATATLRVLVTDDANRTPISGARVTIAGEVGSHEATTDVRGVTEVPGLAVGHAFVTAEAQGFVRSYVEEVSLRSGQAHEVELELAPGTTVTGVVRRARDGTPVAGARVLAEEGGSLGSVMSWSDTEFGSVTTDGDGVFRFPGLPMDQICTLEVRASGLRTARKCFIWHAGASERPPAVVELEPGGRVIGTVRGPDGAIVPGALVDLFPEGADPALAEPADDWWGDEEDATQSTKTDAAGAFVIDGLALDLPFAARAHGKESRASRLVTGLVATANDPTRRIDLTLREPGRLVVHLVSPEGRRVGLPALSLGNVADAPDEEKRSGDHVACVFERVSIGRTVLRVQGGGYLSTSVDVEIQEALTTEVTLRLERGVSISGVVVDDSGMPLSGILVFVYAAPGGAGGSSVAEATTNGEGRFCLEGLVPGEYELHGLGWLGVERLEGIRAPAEGVRLVAHTRGSVTGRLVLPPGAVRPSQVSVGSSGELSGRTFIQDWGDGTFEYEVDHGHTELRISGRGFAPHTQPIAVGPGDRVDLGTIRLDLGIELAGVVVETEGEPIPAVSVDVWGHEHGQAGTGLDGRFRVEHIRAGEIGLNLHAEGYLERSIRMSQPTSRDDLHFELARGGLLRVAVVRADGTPAAGLAVVVEPADEVLERDGYDLDSFGEADEYGRFLARMLPGEYEVRIQTERGEEARTRTLATGRAWVKEGETAEVDLRLAASE